MRIKLTYTQPWIVPAFEDGKEFFDIVLTTRLTPTELKDMLGKTQKHEFEAEVVDGEE